jgi:hypothetical protein
MYTNFYIAENILDHPGQLAIIKLSDPQVFVRFNYEESYFADYEDFVDNIIVIEWLNGASPSRHIRDSILIDCWNFLALTEEEEERLGEQYDY